MWKSKCISFAHLFHFMQPTTQTRKWPFVGDVVDEQNALRTAWIRPNDGGKATLTGRVPQLQTNTTTVQQDDGRLVRHTIRHSELQTFHFGLAVVIVQTVQNLLFADVRITDQQEFERVIVRFGDRRIVHLSTGWRGRGWRWWRRRCGWMGIVWDRKCGHRSRWWQGWRRRRQRRDSTCRRRPHAIGCAFQVHWMHMANGSTFAAPALAHFETDWKSKWTITDPIGGTESTLIESIEITLPSNFIKDGFDQYMKCK